MIETKTHRVTAPSSAAPRRREALSPFDVPVLDAHREGMVEKVAGALNPGGRFLFTAPKEPLEWLDAMTGRQSQSLGAQTYERLLRDAGLTWVAEAQDEIGRAHV